MKLVRQEIGAWLVEHGVSVIEDVNAHEALMAWDRMRQQRDAARAIAVELEQENARLTERLWQLLEDSYHTEGSGPLNQTCLLCGEPWPCIGWITDTRCPECPR